MGVRALGPEGLEAIRVQEHPAGVRLGVQVGGDDVETEIRVHPGQVIDQRGLAGARLVVEERDGLHGAGLTITPM